MSEEKILQNAQSFENRANENIVINGDFKVAQRGTNFTGVAASLYHLDRWAFDRIGAGVVTIDQVASGNPNVPFHYYFRATVTTADASLTGSDNHSLRQGIEGLNTANLKFGSTNAKFVTVSFWHAHTQTGTYSVSLRNNPVTHTYVAEYTQSVSDTWEYSTITIPGHTTGTWAKDNTTGIHLSFNFGAASGLQTAPNVWTSGNFVASTNQVNGYGTVSNNLVIGNVKFEEGAVATPFVSRSFAEELALCQRYYEKSYDYGTSVGSAVTSGAETTSARTPGGQFGFLSYSFQVTKRAAPSMRYWAINGTQNQITVDGVTHEAPSVGNPISGPTTHGARGDFGITTTSNKVQWQWDAVSEI